MAEEKAATKKPNVGLIAGIIAAIVAVVVIVVIAISGSGSKVVGKYKLTAFIGEDGKESTEMISLLNAFGGSYTIEFKSDKTGTMEVKGGEQSNSMKFTYDDKKVKFEATEDSEGGETDYTYKNDTVTITYEGQGMKFEREK